MNDSPFSKRFGHDLSSDDVKALFVEDRTLMDNCCSKQNTLIWGFRGSGKTMLSRYFDLEVQCKDERFKDFQEYIQECDFIGFHLNFVCGAFDMPNLDFELDEGNQGGDHPVLYSRMAYTISEHLIISAILEKIIKKLAKCMDDSCNPSFFYALATDIAKVMEINLTEDMNTATGILESLAKKINTEKTNVAESLTMFSMGFKMAFEPMQRYMTFEYTFKPVVEVFQKRLGRVVPVYLLLDDVKNLHTFQQKQINSWIGQRVYDLVCFKIACEPLEQKAFGTLSNTGRILKKDHDYNEIYLDFDTTITDFNIRRSTYIGVADRRIKRFYKDEQAPSIEEIFSESPVPVKELEHITEELDQKYPGAQHEVYGGKWLRLRRETNSMYAGMDDLTILSFGNIRVFLSICDEIFQKEASSDGHIQPVPPEKQHEAILSLSREFSQNINSLYSFCEKRDEDWKLERFVRNLLDFFRFRLSETNSAEKPFGSFAVKNQTSLPNAAKLVLRRGIERQFFRKSYYRLKDGGRQDAFVINKLLFPEHGLNIRELGSKYELSAELFRQALEEDDVFEKAAKASLALGQLTIDGLVDIVDIVEEEGDPEYEFGGLY